MTAKIICRLLDPNGRMLGWTEHHAAIRGDGCIRADGNVSIPVDREGDAQCVSLHWCEVNSEIKVPLPSFPGTIRANVGDYFRIYSVGQEMIRVGFPPVNLEPVTVGRPITIGVPAGQMGAMSLPPGQMG